MANTKCSGSLPEPTQGARETLKFSMSLVEMFPTVGPALRRAMEWGLERRLADGMRILEDRITRDGRHRVFEDLTDSQKDFLIPQAYLFAERIRQAEYEHNLQVLAEIIAKGICDEDLESDAAKTFRIARRIEALGLRMLRGLVCCQPAFVEVAHRSPSIGIGPDDLINAGPDHGLQLNRHEAMEILHELATRGLLTPDVPRTGPHLYLRNAAFEQVYVAAQSIIREYHSSPT